MNQIPEFVRKRKALYLCHWNERVNRNTDADGYFIDYAGSLFAGQPNTQNTIDEILERGEKYGFESFTEIRRIHPSPGDKVWEFHGNCLAVSNAFSVYIWKPSLAKRVRARLQEIMAKQEARLQEVK